LAARIISLRVGHHADYTRMVFELDSFIGYQVEHQGNELVISLEAAAEPKEIKPAKGHIKLVELESAGESSVAYVHLSSDNLKIKEMTLANPPRIVIDLLAARPVPKPAAAVTPSVVPTPSVAPKQNTQQTASRAPTPEATPVKEIKEPKSVARAVPSKTSSLEPTSPFGQAEKSSDADRAGKTIGTVETIETIETVETVELVTPTTAAVSNTPKSAEPRNAAAPKPERKLSRPSLAPIRELAVEEESAFGGPTVWAAAGVGLVVLMGVGIVIKRRSGAASEWDVLDDNGLGDDDPFADLTPESSETASAGQPVDATQAVPTPTLAVPLGEVDPSEPTEPVPFGQPVDTSEFDMGPTAVVHEAEERKPLDLPIGPDSDDLPLRHGATGAGDATGDTTLGVPPAGAPAAGAGSQDIGQSLKEIERRVAGIETRIDEIADGRERIERQVAAQTEELRVQRAAIARTQRAVRNISRPDDEGSATEPALRNPKAPAGPRQE